MTISFCHQKKTGLTRLSVLHDQHAACHTFDERRSGGRLGVQGALQHLAQPPRQRRQAVQVLPAVRGLRVRRGGCDDIGVSGDGLRGLAGRRRGGAEGRPGGAPLGLCLLRLPVNSESDMTSAAPLPSPSD